MLNANMRAIKRMVNKEGGISLATLFTIVGAVVASILWIMGYVAMAIAPIKAEADENSAQISNITSEVATANVKLDFILGVYGAKYSPQTQTVIEASSTH